MTLILITKKFQRFFFSILDLLQKKIRLTNIYKTTLNRKKFDVDTLNFLQ